ncbi:hypothetical protein QYE76_046303 [Lolium multiflorum]|uniref:NET domain-containing protein n=1 Tax=Lolium multiflorum TaxID=4521 RepID=A0AAD8WYI4_LOLMU|nr:hypothetical protein QYE76_046303 [Lolium multiflorum]
MAWRGHRWQAAKRVQLPVSHGLPPLSSIELKSSTDEEQEAEREVCHLVMARRNSLTTVIIDVWEKAKRSRDADEEEARGIGRAKHASICGEMVRHGYVIADDESDFSGNMGVGTRETLPVPGDGPCPRHPRRPAPAAQPLGPELRHVRACAPTPLPAPSPHSLTPDSQWLWYNPTGRDVHTFSGNLLVSFEKMVKPRAGKVRKPNAQVPNKRGMSSEEKNMLKVGLESFPEEKMHNVMQIVQKRSAGNPELLGDAIELDIDEMDI